jgi:hypothetical protein
MLGTKDIMDCFEAKFKTSSLDNHVTPQGSSNGFEPVTRTWRDKLSRNQKPPAMTNGTNQILET